MLSQSTRAFRQNLLRLRQYATSVPTGKYPVGSEMANYVVDRVQQVPEFNMTAVELTHKISGSKHLHIERQDRNNVFGVVVKTNSPDDSGLPHMLEHTTLCGSDKFPVRDPFFKMLNRSLANFMNAMTGHDYTYFPFATTNKVDFENLMDVYLDSVFHPLLNHEDFRQEGWRLEHTDIHDKKSPLKFKGVVYNEMKGQISDPAYYFWINFQQNIYPSLHNSGGNPAEIVNSYYDDLLDFHSRQYHPSNCWTYTYGSFPLETSLGKIDKAFATFGKRYRKMMVKNPIKLDECKYVEIPGPVDPMVPSEKQYKSSLTWYAGKPTDIYESFKIKILSTLLMDGHSSPLYKGLIEQGIGTSFSANSGMDALAAVNLFSVGLNGLTKDQAAKLEDTVLDILKQVQQSGFPENRVKGILYQLDLGRKIENANFGLNLLSALAPGLVDGIDPLSAIKWSGVLDKFRKEYKADGNKVFADLIQKYMLESPYFKYTMRPDANVPERLAQAEEKSLKEREERMTSGDKEIIYNKGLELEKFQKNQKEDLSCLPTLHSGDIEREGHFPRIKETLRRGLSVQSRISPKTNGVTYFRALKSLSVKDIPENLIEYLPLFSTCLTNLGTKDKSISEIEDEVKLYTAGLGSTSFAHSSVLDPNDVLLKFTINSACLDKNTPKMLSIWENLLLETNFRNIEKLKTLVKSLVSDNISAIVSSGHSFASSYASSKLTSLGNVQESLTGIKQVKFLNSLSSIMENGDIEKDVVPKLEEIAAHVRNASNFKYAITCGREASKDNEKDIRRFDKTISSNKKFELTPYEASHSKDPELPLKNSFVEIPSQTNFASSVLRGSDYCSKDAASLQLLSQLLTFKYLHKYIREQGGAYGGGASYDALNGLFSFYSYRDPKPFESENKFVASTKFIMDKISTGEITNQDLEQAKLTIFQKIDAPEAVGEEGLPYFNFDVDDDARQERRENLLDCSLADIQNVANEYFASDKGRANVIIGSADAKASSENQKDWEFSKL
ncbi:hypothetical protein HII13_001074 [Brettanomyces bruxellensis]|nr:hypothetical protein HII13_001074 [Brettanomyces bruxellensis]